MGQKSGRSDLRATLPAPFEQIALDADALDDDDDAPRRTLDSRVRPASIRERPTEPPPPDLGLTPLDVPFEADRTVVETLRDRARRIELLATLLRGGSMPPAGAVRAIASALGALAEDGGAEGATLALALRAAVGSLGVGRPLASDARVVDTLIFDETRDARDLVALAVETRGHPVRCAATYDDFVRELGVRRPGLVVAEIDLTQATPSSFCAVLCDLLGEAGVPFVLFSDVDAMELADLAYLYGARRGVPKRLGLGVLLSELDEVYRQILELRGPERVART